ncbi:MAG: MlaC/ttg2D family ABC transporter substrate-binding protein [Methylobacter sp.]
MRNLTKHYALFSFIGILLGLMLPSIGVAESLQAPQQIIEDVSNELQQKLHDKSFTQDFAQVTRFVNGVIEEHTDFAKIAPLVLGKNWKSATDQEKNRFTREFQMLIVRTYSRAFIEYNDWTIRFLPLEMPQDASKVLVKTEIIQPGQQPLAVNYRMLLTSGSWKVYDIVIEGVSLVTNYRTTFNEELQTKGSLSAVIDGLAQRNAEALSAKGS